MVNQAICNLAGYGLETGLIQKEDEIYAVNQLLEVLKLDEYEKPEEAGSQELEDILKELLDYACEQGIIEDSIGYRDLLDTRLMNCLIPRPSEVIRKFWELYKGQSPEAATDYFYKLSQDSDYIRRYRVCKDMKWVTKTKYGELDITVNLSKPEKDPKAIAAAKLAKQSGYPKCLLCMENEGYAGRLNHPARNNLRVIPITVNQSGWGFQYSPYVYYNEHCIVFNGQHIPMNIERDTFVKLFDFIKLFPHYFLGSNADLPIVGGSILSHDHFQGGHYEFAMAKAAMEKHVSMPGYEDVEAGIVYWPMSVLRLRGKDSDRLIEVGTKVLSAWRTYTDEDAVIYAETDGEPHNTITPIARKNGEWFELDLVLRNNLTTKEYPLGIYHPHQDLHHIKKENIGLIEVMGLAVLPARLKEELALLGEYILEGKDMKSHEELAKHADWVESFLPKYPQITKDDVEGILQEEVGLVFERVLEDSGVYPCTEKGRADFMRFLHNAGFQNTLQEFIHIRGGKIKTFTICGSMKFAEQMKQIAWKLESEQGVSVIQCVYHEQNEPVTDEVQKRLAAAHYRKIDMCDAVYIVDLDGYIGKAAADEISYARENGKEIIYHSRQS